MVWEVGKSSKSRSPERENHPALKRHRSLNFGFGIADCGFEEKKRGKYESR